MASIWTRAGRLGSMVRIGHTIFGLPFCIAAALLADRVDRAAAGDGLSLAKFGWILLAFTGARTAAMAFNRIVDRDVDALNPRTAARELPSGTVSLRAAWLLTLAATALFVFAAAGLGPWPLRLALPALGIVFGYSLLKRFSASAHLVLGLALAIAPMGAWIAVTGGWEQPAIPAWLALAVATWVAGFDVLYSLQDEDFDRARGLHSIPVLLGRKGALVASAMLHGVTVAALITVHAWADLGPFHAAGLAAITLVLAYEHWIVRPDDLSRLDQAFFAANGWVSIVYLAALAMDLHWASGPWPASV